MQELQTKPKLLPKTCWNNFFFWTLWNVLCLLVVLVFSLESGWMCGVSHESLSEALFLIKKRQDKTSQVATGYIWLRHKLPFTRSLLLNDLLPFHLNQNWCLWVETRFNGRARTAPSVLVVVGAPFLPINREHFLNGASFGYCSSSAFGSVYF